MKKTDSAAGRFSAHLLEALQTRLELLGFELGEERNRVLGTIAAILLAGVFFSVGLLLLNFVLIIAFWEQRLLVSALVAGAYLVVGAVLALVARNRVVNADPPFEATVAELKKDADAFRGGSES
jgi:uncharacterized membrane protein YqjE